MRALFLVSDDASYIRGEPRDRRRVVGGPPGSVTMPTFSNPVLGGDRPDPSILRVGDEYWMTYSSFENARGLPL